MSFDKLSLRDAPEEYFEVSFRDVGPEGAKYMGATLEGIDERGAHLEFRRVGSEYDAKRQALTVYGIFSNGDVSEIGVAIDSLAMCAQKSQHFDASPEQLAS